MLTQRETEDFVIANLREKDISTACNAITEQIELEIMSRTFYSIKRLMLEFLQYDFDKERLKAILQTTELHCLNEDICVEYKKMWDVYQTKL